MNAREYCLLILLVFVVFTGCDTKTDIMLAPQSSPSMKLSFLEFKTIGYDIFTMEDIENVPAYKIQFYMEHVFVKDIQAFLERKKLEAQIDDKQIRLKVEISKGSDGTIYYVDRNGVVLKDGNETFLLGEEDMQRLEKNIIYFHGVVDLRPDLDQWGGSHGSISAGYSPIFMP